MPEIRTRQVKRAQAKAYLAELKMVDKRDYDGYVKRQMKGFKLSLDQKVMFYLNAFAWIQQDIERKANFARKAKKDEKNV